ncbi:MAG: DUF4091 domain-containing protein [Bryobacterales bacterium]|nr:DUF4091 domain-containing protein [Bryobacterales bacterium]
MRLCLFALPFLCLAQPGDLPIPPDHEAALRARGYTERFLPAQDAVLTPSAAETRRGWVVYRRDRNFEVLPNSRPAPGEALDRLVVTATPGEIESEPFAIYALRDTAGVQAAASIESKTPWLNTQARVEDVLFHPVQYTAVATRDLDESRATAQRSYVRYPVFLRPTAAYAIPAGTSRLYWVTVTVPDGTPAGFYHGTIRISDASGQRAELPLSVRVLPFRLTDRDLPRFGAFLSGQKFARGEWAFMKRYGFDALQWFWNSHSIRIVNNGGKLELDFTEYDAFVKGMTDAGMRGPLVLTLGNSWLGHYEIALAKAFGFRLLEREMNGRVVTLADMTDPRWEPYYVEGLRQILAHAKTAGWPPLAVLIMDEPTKHAMAYHPYRYHLVKKHFPELPVYGVFFQPQADPGPLLHSSDILVANRDLDRIRGLAASFGKRFWTYNNITADQSFGKNRLLYGQVPAYYGSEAMFFWCWNYYIGSPWDDFDGRGGGAGQSDSDWVAVYPSVDGVEPVRTLAVEAAREAIDDVRYLKTLEQMAGPKRWARIEPEVRRRQKAMFDGIKLDERINSDADFFIATRNDAPEELRRFVVAEILRLTRGTAPVP